VAKGRRRRRRWGDEAKTSVPNCGGVAGLIAGLVVERVAGRVAGLAVERVAEQVAGRVAGLAVERVAERVAEGSVDYRGGDGFDIGTIDTHDSSSKRDTDGRSSLWRIGN